MRKWVIYTLRCPRTNEVRYVGKTSQTLEKRLFGHYRESRTTKGTHKACWINSLIKDGLRPIIEVSQFGDGDGWQDAEREWIAFYRKLGSDLVNGTDGGEGSAGVKTFEERSAIAKRKYAAMTPEQRLNFRGQSWTQKTKEERSAIMTEARSRRGPLSDEHKRVMHERWLAKYTPEQRSEIARKRQSAKTREKRLEESRKSNVTYTHDARVIAAKKAWLTRKAHYAKDPTAAHMSHVESGKKATETRRAREVQNQLGNSSTIISGSGSTADSTA